MVRADVFGGRLVGCRVGAATRGVSTVVVGVVVVVVVGTSIGVVVVATTVVGEAIVVVVALLLSLPGAYGIDVGIVVVLLERSAE